MTIWKTTEKLFKDKNMISTSRALELLHMDLVGPIDVASIGGSKYAFVIIDDFTRFTWVLFLAHKNEAFQEFSKLCYHLKNEKKVILWQALEVIMTLNLRICLLCFFLMNMALSPHTN